MDPSRDLPMLKEAGLTLREHQVKGIEKILEWYKKGHGGILADEMGLGKTCQMICALVLLKKNIKKPKFVIICPLSVLQHWEHECSRFGGKELKLIIYKGDKEYRKHILSKVNKGNWNVLLTTYQIFRNDHGLLGFDAHVYVVDEAHSVKSQESQLYQIIRQKNVPFHFLLTGTPIQNDLDEFYSLLSLVDSKKYPVKNKDVFLSLPKENLVNEIKKATEEYVLRRLKTAVCKELPSVQEVVLYHGLTKFQRDLYTSILTSNRLFFDSVATEKQSLMSLLVQLRKAVSHPYLFDGIEPEPFEDGVHLFTASAKFMVLDKLLSFLKRNKHRCLIFSQFKATLKILADAMTFRKYSYEYFDGSVNAADRFNSIDEFQKPNSNIFCFLMTTKAGGLGLNLTAADTVIFVDSDLNPQNDIQAAARCHRIGQNKPVKIIKLLAEHTVDEAIQRRWLKKLKLSEFILHDKTGYADIGGLKEVLLSSLATLKETENTSEEIYELLNDEYFISLLGKTDKNGRWVNEVSNNTDHKEEESIEEIELFPRAEKIICTTKKSKSKLNTTESDKENSNDIVVQIDSEIVPDVIQID